MENSIRNFTKQFLFEPVVKNAEKLKQFGNFIVCGMGGSNHFTEIANAWDPKLNIVIHRSYGLPELGASLNSGNTLVIASSFSGNTEEAIDSYYTAQKLNIPVVAITSGGELLQIAQKESVPYVQVPHEKGVEPRTALGFTFRALMKLMQNNKGLNESEQLYESIIPEELESSAKKLVEKLDGFVPVIYSSPRNRALGYIWKINFNETGKIPAYYNVVPESNHNEINGYDLTNSTRDLAKTTRFIFLKDSEDYPRIIKRLDVVSKLYRERGLEVEEVNFEGKSRLERLFLSVLLSYWVSYYTAKNYGRNPEGVPIIEELKKLMKNGN